MYEDFDLEKVINPNPPIYDAAKTYGQQEIYKLMNELCTEQEIKTLQEFFPKFETNLNSAYSPFGSVILDLIGPIGKASSYTYGGRDITIDIEEGQNIYDITPPDTGYITHYSNYTVPTTIRFNHKDKKVVLKKFSQVHLNYAKIPKNPIEFYSPNNLKRLTPIIQKIINFFEKDTSQIILLIIMKNPSDFILGAYKE